MQTELAGANQEDNPIEPVVAQQLGERRFAARIAEHKVKFADAQINILVREYAVRERPWDNLADFTKPLRRIVAKTNNRVNVTLRRRAAITPPQRQDDLSVGAKGSMPRSRQRSCR